MEKSTATLLKNTEHNTDTKKKKATVLSYFRGQKFQQTNFCCIILSHPFQQCCSTLFP